MTTEALQDALRTADAVLPTVSDTINAEVLGAEPMNARILGSYGVGGNPYLVLPIFGPSSPRDAIGRGVDILTDPLTHTVPTGLGRIKTGVQLISDRERILDETDTLEATSVDFYAAIRSFYYQNREFEIANGREIVRPAPGTDIEEDLYDDIDDEELEDLEPDLQSN